MKTSTKRYLLLLWLPLVLFISSPINGQTLIINEVSNGANGNKEFIEFVVVDASASYNCENNAPPCVDIRGWIFDDNSGYHGNGGIANGALRFSSNTLWSCVPVGTIILVYNDADPGLSIPPNDLSINDGNCRIVAPISNAQLFERNGTTPGAVSCSYPNTGWVAGGDWTQVFLANSGDCARLVDLSGCEVFSICWASCTSNTLIYFNSTGSGSQNVWYFNGGDPMQQSNWSEGSASAGGDETPGVANNAANSAYIAQFNNNCQPIPPLVVNATVGTTACGICNGTATASVSGSIPAYSYIWTTANFSPIGIFSSTASGLCEGLYHCIVSSSIGCSDTLHLTIQSTTVGFLNTENISVCNGTTITYPDGVSELITANTSHISNLMSISGCDSTVITNVSLTTGYTSTQSISVCAGTTVNYLDGVSELITTNTTHVSNLMSVSGCDSTVTTNVSIIAGFTSAESISVCSGTTVTYPDGVSELITANTSHVSNLMSVSSCDSTVTTNVSLTAGFTVTESISVCSGSTITYPDGSSEEINVNTVHQSVWTTASGCDSTILTNVTVHPAYVTNYMLELCPGANHQFEDGTVMDSIVRNVSHTSILNTIHGCDSIIQVAVVLTDVSEVSFNITPSEPSMSDYTVTFEALSASGNLHWSISDELGMVLFESTEDSFELSLPNDLPHHFLICLEDEINGCSTVYCDSIKLKPELTVYIPNAFTPHLSGDENGVNDLFLPIIGGAFVRNYSLNIYNRWGDELFSTSDPAMGWDGLYKGKLVERSVYIYKLSFSIVPLTFLYRYEGIVTVVR